MTVYNGVEGIEQLKRAIKRREDQVIRELGKAVLESIRDGSPITGAPGQPVESGELKRSWKMTKAGDLLRITSNVFYAPFIEEGARIKHLTGAAGRRAFVLGQSLIMRSTAIVQRSTVGGFNSVKLTRVAMQKLVDHIVNKVAQIR